MKKTVVACACTALLFASCKHTVINGGGGEASETRNMQAFTEIEIEAPVNAVIKVDSNAKTTIVELSGYKSLLGYIKTAIEGKSLHIYRDNGIKFDTDKDVVATITVPAFSALTISGEGDAEVTGGVVGTDFTARVSGEGEVTLDRVDVDNFNCSVAGVGNIKIGGGHAKRASCALSGAGDMELYDMPIDSCDATISGAGEMELNVISSLNASVSGLGGITYKGHPHVVSKVNGVGSVSPAE